MSYNIWVGGAASGQPLSQTAAVILAGGADVVGLQEQSGAAVQLADMLGYHVHVASNDIAFLSRFPITDTFAGGIEFQIGLDERAYLFNVHYAAYPYGPYDLRDNPNLTEAQLIATARNTRGAANAAVLQAMEPMLTAGEPVFFVGDFNEPSHLDWTNQAANAGLHFGRQVAWPTSQAVIEAGFTDSLRAVRPDPVADPADTWTPGTPAPFIDQNEVLDRIDIVYHAGQGVVAEEVELIGHRSELSDIVVAPYPSDHRAVVARFDVPVALPGILGDVNLDESVDQLDADILVQNWLIRFDPPGLESYLHGDLDISGLVDLADVALLQRGFIEFGGTAPLDFSGIGRGRVPEPSALTLVILAVSGIVAGRRRGRVVAQKGSERCAKSSAAPRSPGNLRTVPELHSISPMLREVSN